MSFTLTGSKVINSAPLPGMPKADWTFVPLRSKVGLGYRLMLDRTGLILIAHILFDYFNLSVIG